MFKRIDHVEIVTDQPDNTVAFYTDVLGFRVRERDRIERSGMGVPISDAPMDFSAWFEVYLGGQWYIFDARNNIPRIGRVLIARGRDAADVAITTTFGPNTLSSFRVWTEEVAAPPPVDAAKRLKAG